MTLAGIGFAVLAGRLAARVGVRRLALAGLIVLGVGLTLLARLPVAGTLATMVVATMVVATMVFEVGFKLSEVPLVIASTSALPPERRGLSASLFNVAVNIGNGLGLTIVGAVVALRAGDRSDDPETLAAALRIGVAVGVVGVVLSALIVALRLPDAPAATDDAESRAETELVPLGPCTRHWCSVGIGTAVVAIPWDA